MAGWIVLVEWLSRLVLFGLFGLSIWSVSIILERRKFFKNLNAKQENKDLENWIKKADREHLLYWSKASTVLFIFWFVILFFLD
jgi:hypothetical protein